MYTVYSELLFPDEVNQSVVRSLNTFIIFIYLVVFSYFNSGSLVAPYTISALIYFIVTMFFFRWSARCVTLPYDCKERFTFRIIGFASDIAVLTCVMLLAGKGGIPLFFLFLWITVANGIRYGNLYLIIAANFSIISFSLVVHKTDIWQDPELIHVALGLLISLLMLPAYILNLISRLSNSLDSERAANQYKKAFLANMNHELRTPLTSISNLVDMIGNEDVPRIENMLSMMKVSTNNLLNIVNSILDMAKIESGHKHNENRFSLYTLIYEIRQILTPQAKKKEVNFFICIDPNCGEFYTGPEDYVKKILINLMSNSIKFTDHGFVKLTVKLSEKKGKREKISFILEDTGIGIPKKDQKKIFKPFTQANLSITKQYGGTGLGMAICDQFAKLIGGEIVLESNENHGTKIKFDLSLTVATHKSAESYDKIIISLIPYNQAISFFETFLSKGIRIQFVSSDDVVNYLKPTSNFILIATSSQITQLGSMASNLAIIELIINSNQSLPMHDLSLSGISSDMEEEIQLNAYKICANFILRNDRAKQIPFNDRKLKILLAEDDNILRDIQRSIFSSIGHDIDVVKSGEEALKMFQENIYDLLVLDVHMPNMSGVEVLKKIKINNPENKTKIVILTADDIDVSMYREKIPFVSKILVKPISPPNLLKEIHELFEVARDVDDSATCKNNQAILQMSSLSVFIDLNIMNEHASIAGRSKFIKMINDYKNEVHNLLKLLANTSSLCQSNNFHEIIHRLKGISRTVGMVAFSSAISFVGQRYYENKDTVLAEKDMRQLQSIHEISLLAFEVEFANND